MKYYKKKLNNSVSEQRYDLHKSVCTFRKEIKTKVIKTKRKYIQILFIGYLIDKSYD